MRRCRWQGRNKYFTLTPSWDAFHEFVHCRTYQVLPELRVCRNSPVRAYILDRPEMTGFPLQKKVRDKIRFGGDKKFFGRDKMDGLMRRGPFPRPSGTKRNGSNHKNEEEGGQTPGNKNHRRLFPRWQTERSGFLQKQSLQGACLPGQTGTGFLQIGCKCLEPFCDFTEKFFYCFFPFNPIYFQSFVLLSQKTKKKITLCFGPLRKLSFSV